MLFQDVEIDSRYFIVKLMQDQGVFLPWITNFYGFHFSIELSGVRSEELDTKSQREGPHIKMRGKKKMSVVSLKIYLCQVFVRVFIFSSSS